MTGKSLSKITVIGLCASAAAILTWWFLHADGNELKLRVPGTDAAPAGDAGGGNPVLAGKLIPGSTSPADSLGDWPQFRGPNRDGIAPERPSPTRRDAADSRLSAPGLETGTPISRDWKTSPPRELWSIEVGEGYAGVAIREGRVYLLDYDRDAKQSALRCLSLADGQEIWRFSYPLSIKRNHGMTRTVPTLAERFVVALDSKCNVFCLDAVSGELQWSTSLVNAYGATVPEWYAGQCPLVDGDKVILAPGGKDALLIALDLATGKLLWQTPNPKDWKMTHSSIMTMDFAGRRQYVYCASKGVVGVDAADGKPLWETTDWKISIATVPSPVPLPDGQIFLTGGYNAGSLMLRLLPQFPALEGSGVGSSENPERAAVFSTQTLFKIPATVFGATQHTPIFKNNHLYGIRADGRFVCLDLDGKVVWASGSGDSFGLGPFVIVDDLIYALNDSGKLSLIEATPAKFQLLAQTQVMSGRESWAPMALAGNRLLLRDLTRLVCLDLGSK
ncbi:MAG TPA: PQQ-like beta-propeller repeat protein [Verrucomicrobiota bacterium]|nr:PQQ-like beta-propeller repeat protein [Verrucomicrobiota bacterium]